MPTDVYTYRFIGQELIHQGFNNDQTSFFFFLTHPPIMFLSLAFLFGPFLGFLSRRTLSALACHLINPLEALAHQPQLFYSLSLMIPTSLPYLALILALSFQKSFFLLLLCLVIFFLDNQM